MDRSGWRRVLAWISWACWLPLLASGTAVAFVPAPSAASQGALSFDDPAAADVTLAPHGALAFQWPRPSATSTLDTQVDGTLFYQAGTTAELEYVERVTPLNLNDAASKLGLPPQAPASPRIHDFHIRLTNLPGPHEVVAFLPGTERDHLESQGSWSLSTLEPALAFSLPSPTGALRLAAQQGTLLLDGPGLTLESRGTQVVYYYGYEVLVEHSGGVDTYKTGAWTESLDAPLGLGGSVALHDAYLIVRASDTDFTADVGAAPVRLLAPTIALSGTVTFDPAWGALKNGPYARSFANELAALEGTYLFSYQSARDAPSPVASHHVSFAGADTAAPDGAQSQGSGTIFHSADASPVVVWAAVTGAALGLVALLRTELLAPIISLFSRLDRSGAEAHPLRRRLLEVAAQEPGLSLQEAGARLGCGWGTLVYHVRVLERHGFLETQRVGRRRCLFERQGRTLRQDFPALALLQQRPAQRLLNALAAGHAGNQFELAAQTGLSQPYVSRLLKRMRATGLVEGEPYRHAVPSLSERGRRLRETLAAQSRPTTVVPERTSLPAVSGPRPSAA